MHSKLGNIQLVTDRAVSHMLAAERNCLQLAHAHQLMGCVGKCEELIGFGVYGQRYLSGTALLLEPSKQAGSLHGGWQIHS